MTRLRWYYLWHEAEIVEDHGDGWVTTRWKEDGKLYRHWEAQLREEPLVRRHRAYKLP